MTREEFISELEFIFNTAEGSLTPETELGSLRGWDSIGMLSVITLIVQLGTTANVDRLQEAKTVSDLVDQVGDKLN